MEYTKYESHTISLEEQNNEFAIRKNTPVRGVLRIETGNGKGAMRIGIQNLLTTDRSNYTYKLAFFGKKDGVTIHTTMGGVVLSRFGNGETYFRFNPQNINEQGYALKDYTYAVVAAASVRKPRAALRPVLMGVLPGGEGKETQVFQEEPVDEGVMAVSSEAGATTEAQREVAAEPTTASEENHTENYNSYYNKNILNRCRQIEELLKSDTNQKPEPTAAGTIEPFNNDRLEQNWYKIDNIKLLPMLTSGTEQLCQRYRHFIFSIGDRRYVPDSTYARDYYYIGVPGRFMEEEQPERGESGFSYWQPIAGAENLGTPEELADSENRKYAYGYWIVAIDKENGDVLEAAPE